jgi:TonB family protein
MAHQTVSRINSPYDARSTDVPAELPVDLTLDEIVQEARLATNATGAALVLAVGSEMICRAKTGATAADVVLYLNTRSGILDACLRTGEVQHCDDAESDPRVQALACRSFGARSIMVVPIRNGKRVLGVIEVFSPRPHDFSDRDVRTLQTLSQRVAAKVEIDQVKKTALAAKVMRVSDQSDPIQVVTVQVSPSKTMSTNPPTEQPGPVIPTPRSRSRNAITLTINRTLLTTVIGLSLLVGWMIGRAGKERSLSVGLQKPRTSSALSPSANSVRAAFNASTGGGQVVNGPAPAPEPLPVASESKSTSNALASQTPVAPAHAIVPQPHSKMAGAATSADIVLFEERKPVRSDKSAADGATRTPRGRAAGGSGTSLPVVVAEEVAIANLLQRVEPEYPRNARDQRIQGSVVLSVVVGKDGSVEQLIPVTGDSELAPAAVAAVRQWRFKPLIRDGKPIEFESPITLNFFLP